jgi:hypothetical protein
MHLAVYGTPAGPNFPVEFDAGTADGPIIQGADAATEVEIETSCSVDGKFSTIHLEYSSEMEHYDVVQGVEDCPEEDEEDAKQKRSSRRGRLRYTEYLGLWTGLGRHVEAVTSTRISR